MVSGQKGISEMPKGGMGKVVVFVYIAPLELDKTEVLYTGQVIVVGVARGKGGSTRVQGALHATDAVALVQRSGPI